MIIIPELRVSFFAWIAKTVSFTALFFFLINISAQPTGRNFRPGNYTTFSEPKTNSSKEKWMRYNDPNYYSHPEFGLKAPNAPDQELVEVLSKRTSNERYFINPEFPSDIYIQKSLGDLHYLSEGFWRTIDPSIKKISPNVFEASHQPDPVGFEVMDASSYIKTVYGKVRFNNWSVYGVRNNKEVLIATGRWDNYTVGDEGVIVHDIFAGIDLVMTVLKGAIKSEFIIRQANLSYEYLLFRDTFHSSNHTNLNLKEDGSGAQLYGDSNQSILTIGETIMYNQEGSNREYHQLSYALDTNTLDIIINTKELSTLLELGDVIVDPLVTSTATLAQAAVTGSMYNASCNFTNSCDYVLNITPPANATITNFVGNFSFYRTYPCFIGDGSLGYQIGSCLSTGHDCGPVFSPTYLSCYGDDLPWNNLSACMPQPSCNPAPLAVTLKFYRSCYGSSGCNNNCIGAFSPWVLTMQATTLEFTSTSPTQQITLSATTVCPGGPITATANVQYGVPPYTVNWSLNNTGTPSIGTGTSITPTLTNPGTNTIYCFVTDACGSTITSSRNITVTNPSAGPNVTSPVNYCIGATATPLTSPGTGLKWYSTATGGTQLGSAPVPSTTAAGTTSYWVSQTVSGCESQRSQIDVIVHPSPTVTGTPIVTPSQCDSPTGSITGISTTAPGPITYTWYNSTGDVLSTSTTSSDLTNQPGGEYSLMITDGNGCQGTQGGYIIPLDAAPVAPTVVSPVNYCHYDPAQPLEAIGSSLIWYTDASLTNGSVTAPTPNTNLTLTTNYFVTQTINGCESIPAQITAIVKPKPSLPTVTSPVSYCQFETPETLTANGTDLLWYTTSSGGTGSSTPPAISTDNYSNTTYYVSQTVNGCEGGRAAIQVDIIAIPTFSGNPQITPSACDQATGGITGVLADMGNSPMMTFQWHNDNGDQVASSLSLNNQPSGNYTLTALGQLNCSASYGPVFIPLIAAPAGPLAPSPVEYCMGSTAIALTANGAALNWYTTSTGGTASNVAPTPSTQTVGSTNYYVSQIVNGCESDRTEIVVNVLDAPGAEFNVNTQTGCAPFCLLFENLSTPTGAPINHYEWKANGSVFSNSMNPTHCLQTGTYTIELTVTDAVGCTKTVSKNDYITVVPAPVSHFIADKYEAPEHSSTISFQTANPKANETVVWNFGDGSTATGNYVSYPFPGVGQYCITHTVTSNYGCSDQSERCVIITSEFNLHIPNSFTPGGDGINDVWKPVLRGKFSKYSVSIYNRWGERVFFSNDPEVSWVGDVQNGDYFFAPDGMYHYVIVIEDEKAIPTEYRGHLYLLR